MRHEALIYCYPANISRKGAKAQSARSKDHLHPEAIVFSPPIDLLSSFASWRLCVRCLLAAGIVITSSSITSNSFAADNELTSKEKMGGWQLLFNGKNTKGWRNNIKKPVKAKVEDGALNPHGSGGYVLVYDKPFGDFVIKCDVKMDQPSCNSGIFVRIGELKDPVQSGLEVQINTATKPDLHSFGAIYDLVPPSKDATHGRDKWDTVEVRCEGPKISVTVNGEKVTSIDCDKWTKPGKRLDGTSTKFKKAIKDFARKGYLGLQDHGNNVWYKNIKLREL
jgi:hypothetical protein